MDALAALLDWPRAHQAFLLRTVMDPPWCLHIRDESPLSLIAIVRGDAWVTPDGGTPDERTPVHLGVGDLALLRGPDHYSVGDDPATPPQVVIHPGQRCTTLDGGDMAQAMDLGVRTWGNDLDGATVMLSGTYETTTTVGQGLLAALPPLLVVPHGTWDNPLVGFLAGEVVRDEPGQEAVLDRLLDLLVIAVLRVWFSRDGDGAPAWYQAHADPVVGRALRLLFNDPARPWTVASLAAEVGLSRAALARQFTDLVGEPPMTFLTNWRLALAAERLRQPQATVTAVAREVGYGSPFALSTAFKRVYGLSPREHQQRATHRPPAATTAAP